MDDYQYRHRDGIGIGFKALLYGIGIITLLGVLSLFAGLWRLPMMNLQREVTQRSQQYTETKVALLRSLYTEHTDLGVKLEDPDITPQLARALRAQQASLVRRMREQADLIPASEIPSDIRTFLNR